MTGFFPDLFEYSNYSNEKLIIHLNANSDKISEKSLQLMNHIINAHQIWNSRIIGVTPFKVWEIRPLNELTEIESLNYKTTLKILDEMDTSKIVAYTNSNGVSFQNTVGDILFHIINHSTYHRAQIATECRNGGFTPLVTDYIFFRRDKDVR